MRLCVPVLHWGDREMGTHISMKCLKCTYFLILHAVFQMALCQKYDKYILDGLSSLYLK